MDLGIFMERFLCHTKLCAHHIEEQPKFKHRNGVGHTPPHQPTTNQSHPLKPKRQALYKYYIICSLWYNEYMGVYKQWIDKPSIACGINFLCKIDKKWYVILVGLCFFTHEKENE